MFLFDYYLALHYITLPDRTVLRHTLPNLDKYENDLALHHPTIPDNT